MRLIVGIVFGLVLACARPALAETYTLDYEAAVLGVVVVGEAHYSIDADADGYEVRSTLRTSGLARLFDQTDITASSQGAITQEGLSWRRYSLAHNYAQKSRRTTMTRSASGVALDIAPQYGNMGSPPASADQRYGSHDPLSAVFALGRQVSRAGSCQGAVRVFDGRQHYRLSLTPKGVGTYSGGGYDGRAISCYFHYQPIAGFNRDFDRSNIPTAVIWFAMQDDASFAPPLRLTVPTPLGEARLDLRGFQRR